MLAVTDCEDNVSDRRPATTIGELDIHLGNVMEQIAQLSKNVDGVKESLSRLATRDYVDDQVRLVKETIHQSRPTTQLKSLAGIVGSILVLVTFCGLMIEAVLFLQHVRQSLPAAPTIGAKP